MVERLIKAETQLSVAQAETVSDIEQARSLFKEYEMSLGISLCFQSFDRELANLPGDYAPPFGRLLLAHHDGQLAGCIALRKLTGDVCEMKRLYLRQNFRGKGLGRAMLNALLNEAKRIGYSKIRLDTLPGRMDDAISLYRSIGFKEINAYYNNPVDALYMELDLTQP
jgi:putative acetyltransferase